MSKKFSKNDNDESHPLLPSGEWEGFYCYNNSPEQHKMQLELRFSNLQVQGSGFDDIDTFSWNGNYDLTTFKINLTKNYPTHQILYFGDIDENGIWGVWENRQVLQNLSASHRDFIKNQYSNLIKGGFHIWPKKGNNNEINAEAKSESKKLKEIYN